MKNEITICVGGRQGEGIASLGTMLSQSLVDYGYHVFGYRNFSSRIKGGPSSYNLRISTTPIETNRKKIDILLALSLIHIYPYLIHSPQRIGLVYSNQCGL